MTASPKPLVAGNWKMNGLKASLTEVQAIRDGVSAGGAGRADVAVCPPATLIAAVADLCRGSQVGTGAQDCHAKESGAHTGDISAAMLKDAGAAYVIVGHSERRTDHHETSEQVRAKAEAAIAAGLVAILCVGETQHQREAGETLSVVGEQIEKSWPRGASPARLVIAYEPIWAIGTGLTPTPADVAEVHAFIRRQVERLLGEGGAGVRLLYGGSVKPSNASELMAVANVDGALVGGASLTAKDFLGIAAAYKA
ncbi:MAG: triose-phosphate isomerase [Beijerinckiaceae bacterium]|jgi:triosephosphate isomerase (TIM)|nr:triose-phosphate isomerase [Beijerinckiaceae bacterium]